VCCLLPALAQGQTTALYMKSEPGDYIGAGAEHLYTPEDGVQVNVTRYVFGGGIGFHFFRSGSPTLSWSINLGAGGPPLEQGTYPVAVRLGRSYPELSISGSGRACTGFGRFEVLEVVYDGSGNVERLAVDAEQHCVGSAAGLFVALRYSSTISSLQPFGGNYPRYELQIALPANGRIVGDGIDCGGGASSCTRTFAEPQAVALTAVPDPGFIFTGWSGRCSGPETVEIEVTIVTPCSATFSPPDPPAPWTVLFWDSSPGDYVGGGMRSAYTPANSVWRAARQIVGTRAEFSITTIENDGESSMYVTFDTTAGPVIPPGTYVDDDNVYPSLVRVGKDSRGCGADFNRMTIHEWDVDADGLPTRVAADIEQRCPSTAPPLLLTLRYNSTVPLPLRAVALQQSPASPSRFGEPLTWTAVAAPGGGVEYTFWIRRAGGLWQEVQPYGISSTYSWTPAYADIGDLEMQVRARRTGTATEVTDIRSFTVSSGRTPVVRSLSTSAPLPVPAGATVTWSASSDWGEKQPHYRFWLRDAAGWRIVQDYGPSSSYTWQTTAADVGSYALQVWARNSDSPADYESFASAVFDVRPPDPLNVTLLPSSASAPPWPTGARITWVALARGGVGPHEYRYWIRDPAGVWTIARDYTPDPTFAWTPTETGSYDVQVWVRNAGSIVTWDAYRSATAEISNGPIAVRWSNAPSGPVKAGRLHYWQAEASGGTSGPLEYQFWRYDGRSSTWSIVQPWSAKRQYFWTPTTSDLGQYSLHVWVRNAGSTASWDAWLGASFSVVDQQAVTAVQLSPDVPFPAPTHLPITWRATANSPDAQYRFWIRSPAGSWSMIRDYLAFDSATFSPTSEGTYMVEVWSRRGTTSASYEASANSVFEVRNNAAPLRLTGLHAEPELGLATEGFPIRWTAQASGGNGWVEFKFLVYDEGRDEWTVGRDWLISPAFDWRPTRAGRYAVQAMVRPVGSTDYTDVRTSEAFTVAAASSNSPAWIALDRASPVTGGQPVTITAGATAAGAFEYRFTLVWENFGTTTVLQDWSTSATTVWTPLTPGPYRVQVTIRRAGSFTSVATVSTATISVQ
jgi:hypothetical protein